MRLILGIIAIVVLTVDIALPQDNEGKKTRFGIGVQLNPPSDFLEVDEAVLSLPIGYSVIQFTILMKSIKIESTFGIFRFNEKRTGEHAFEDSNSQLRLGVGVYWVSRKKNTFFYSGGHFGIIRNERSETKTDLALGPVVGVEHLFDNHLSIGGEAQLKYLSIDHRDEPNRSESVITTNSAITLRWYF